MKAGRVLLRIILILLIGSIVGVAFYSWNAKVFLHDQLPMPFGIGLSVVLTGSMVPTLNVNDVVVIKSYDSYSVGDIVVFQKDGDMVIHRMIEYDEADGMIKTKGDANNVDDGYTSIDAVKGKYLFKIGFIGVIVNAVKSLPGMIIILGFAIFLMIRSFRNEKEESSQNNEELRKEIEKLRGELENDLSKEESQAESKSEPEENDLSEGKDNNVNNK